MKLHYKGKYNLNKESLPLSLEGFYLWRVPFPMNYFMHYVSKKMSTFTQT
jgi:hypothetical protein